MLRLLAISVEQWSDWMNLLRVCARHELNEQSGPEPIFRNAGSVQ